MEKLPVWETEGVKLARIFGKLTPSEN